MFEIGVMHDAVATTVPWLDDLTPRAKTSALNSLTTAIPRESTKSVRYSLDGMTAYGMIERPSPVDLCEVVQP